MKYYVDQKAAMSGNGSCERPFTKIGDAARVAQPGDEVIVAPGVYREYVDPKYAGREDARIVYRSEEPLGAVITGAEECKNWAQYEGNVWTARVKNSVFGDYNPYTTYVCGDWYFAPTVRHTGSVFLNDRMMYETVSYEECLQGKPDPCSWVPPAAYQDGLIGPHWSRGWIIEDCEVSNSRCCGISLGKYRDPENDMYFYTKHVKSPTQMERDAVCRGQYHGWSKETIGSHIIRRCHIHHCEQTGIVGRMGAVFSTIEDCHIHHICNTQQLGGAETAGIKIHAAIDVTIQRNHIHNCIMGVWCDWEAQGTRITRNLLHDNHRPDGVKRAKGATFSNDVFIEVGHGPTLIDNNIMLSKVSVAMPSEGIAFVHNLMTGGFSRVNSGVDSIVNGQREPRYTPYHFGHLPVWIDGNAYFGGASVCRHEKNGYICESEPVSVELEMREEGPVLRTNLYELLQDFRAGGITTDTLGRAFEPEQRYENPDGSPITFDTDYFGSHRGPATLPGPFAAEVREKKVY